MAKEPARCRRYKGDDPRRGQEAPRFLKLEAELKGDHAGGAVAAETYAEEARWRRGGVGEGAEAGLSGGLAGDTGEDHVGQAEVWMVEHIEELDVEAQLHALGESETIW